MEQSRLIELEAGVSRPPAPRGPGYSPARIPLSHLLAVRADEYPGTTFGALSAKGWALAAFLILGRFDLRGPEPGLDRF
ncbi:hypothetical protein GCM10010439_74250 [Actinocorallia aurantiaca]|uniref:Uncharacterized protein n=1 Tax=Actinocorallia aurantiaca TaxID=46204 RepID=A0ABN3UWJ3_9ACTN